MKLITIIGPTASGKTTLAAHLAFHLDAEIISGDSRQVYRGMTIGTGKDLADYVVNGKQIPYHLIDIADAGFEYNTYMFQRDFHKAYKNIQERNKQAIFCGGSGLYIEAVLKGYHLPQSLNDPEFRASLENKTHEELIELLASLEKLHNTTDTKDRNRTIHAIEVAVERKKKLPQFSPINSTIFCIKLDREIVRSRITQRLKQRLQEGMLDEANALIKQGVTIEQLKYYGLEYKYMALHLEGKLTYDEMFSSLNTAIHQFAKRQMTWFRKMERSGMTIHWIDGTLSMEEKINFIKSFI